MTTFSEQLAHQQQLSAQQLEQRRGMADDLTAPRPIDHSGVFPDKESAEAVRRELKNLGYEVGVMDDQGYVLLEARKDSAVDAATVDEFTMELLTVFQKFGGDYDGWGGPVVSLPSPGFGSTPLPDRPFPPFPRVKSTPRAVNAESPPSDCRAR